MQAKRGQLWISDILLATMVYSVLLLLTLVLWGHISSSYSSVRADGQAAAALEAVDFNLFSQGSPSDWELNFSNSTVPGIISSGLFLSEAKSEKLESMSPINCATDYATDYNYTLLRQRLGAGGYYVFVNSSEFYFGCVPVSAVRAFSSSRLVELNGSVVRVDVVVWR